MVLTEIEIKNIIDNNLADLSNILPIKHREVEYTLLEAIVELRKLMPRNIGSIANIDVGGVNAGIVVSGDVTSCSAISPSAEGTTLTINLANSMDNLNYMVKPFIGIASTNSPILSAEIGSPIFKVISPTQFELAVVQFTPRFQDLKIYIETIQLY